MFKLWHYFKTLTLVILGFTLGICLKILLLISGFLLSILTFGTLGAFFLFCLVERDDESNY